MALFQEKKGRLATIKERPFKLEKELQKLTEDNLGEIFGLKFVSTEFQLNNQRIDTLAYDEENKSFVIIEYKRSQSFSVVDQGFSYLSLLLNNKAEFVLEYNRRTNENTNKDDFDWSQTRVMFLARSFTTHQQGAINFKDLPIELWEVTRYANDLVLYDQVEADGANTSINTLSDSKKIQTVSKEVKSYTEEGYLSSKPNGKGRELYDLMKEKVFNIDPDLVIHPTKTYLAVRKTGIKRFNIISFHIFRDKLRIDLTRSKPSDFKDPENKVKYMKNSMQFFNQHISHIEFSNEKDLDYGIYIIKQLYDRLISEE